ENKVDIEKTKLAFGPLLKIDSKKEVFTNIDFANVGFADVANGMLTRQYRKPFVVPSEKDL
ncbi:hypothetical protein MNBD_PLANCTO02-2894, partial [hydrothermal vent metagenome]